MSRSWRSPLPQWHNSPPGRCIAFGYYWAGAKPVLTVASGDIVEVETLITSRPDRLEAAGVPPGEVQQSLRNIVDSVTDRGPGGHILNGPIFVQGAEPGDVLEVRILSVDLAIPYLLCSLQFGRSRPSLWWKE